MRLVSFAASLAALAGVFALASRWYGTSDGSGCRAGLGEQRALCRCEFDSTGRVHLRIRRLGARALRLRHRRPTPTRSAHVGGSGARCGLDIHLHTAITAAAVGVAYLSQAVVDRKTSVPSWQLPIVGYVIGYVIGGAAFLAVSVMPSPATYFRSAAQTRLASANSDDAFVRTDDRQVVETFLSPRAILRKEIAHMAGCFAPSRNSTPRCGC